MRGIFMQMNEQSPERHPFRPTYQYKETVGFLLNNIFTSPALSPEMIDPETMTTWRSWEKGGTIFWASGVDPQYIPLMIKKPDAYRVAMLRMNQSQDGLMQVRSYLYDRLSGEMQAANWLFTSEELATMELTSPKGQLHAKAIEEGFAQHVYTASPVDYLDFLADIDGFRESSEV